MVTTSDNNSSSNSEFEELRRDFDSFLLTTFDQKEKTSTSLIESPTPDKSTAAGKGTGNAILHSPASKHYFSHKIAHHAFLVPGPKLVKPTVCESPSPVVISTDRLFAPSPQISDTTSIEDMSKKFTADGMSKKFPLVVIPRRRKHKNYVSRRRNTQILASLRKCNSDPNVYRSYNSWTGLVIQDAPKNKRSNVLQQPNQIKATPVKKEGFGIQKLADDVRKVPGAPLKPSEIKRRESGKSTTKAGDGNNQLINKNPASTVVPPFNVSRRLNMRRTQQVLLPEQNVAKPSTSSSNLVASPPESLPTSAVPSPQPPVHKTAHAVGPRRPSSKRKNKIDDFSSIKKDLLESAAKLDLAKHKITSLNLDKEESTTSDDTKAKKTVNAISAAFSNLKVESSQNTTSEKVASKPPTTPSSGRREIIKPVTPKSKLRNVPPTSGPTQPKRTPPPQKQELFGNEKLSSDEDDDIRRPPEAQAVQSSISQNVNDVIAQAELVLADEERIKPPILQLSKQPILSHGPPLQVPGFKRSQNPPSANLLSSLQLPPSVSRKVDKIIASGGKKLTTVMAFIFR